MAALNNKNNTGPLDGLKVVELAGIGPGPHCCMMLADMGAEVIRVEPPGGRSGDPQDDILCRSRKNVVINLKSKEGVQAVLRMVENADVLVEGFRPGVAEKMGLGPDECLKRNRRLVYGRMTGWGQTGPMAKAAGHDINYISLSGALHAIGRKGGPPVAPLNLVGDFGGGSMLLAFGIACAIIESKSSGHGQVVDAAMVDGSATLMAATYGMLARGFWTEERGSNLLDTGAHFYDSYETQDGKFVSIGPIEKKFYKQFLRLVGLKNHPDLAPSSQFDVDDWPQKKEVLQQVFKTKTRDQWCDILEGTDVCFAPVLSMSEAPEHPHAKARNAFVEVNGAIQPAPAPRFSRSLTTSPRLSSPLGADTVAVLHDAGYSQEDIRRLLDQGHVFSSKL